ncbi:MAG: acyl-CoA dehydrogenase family protein [Deltaproteobacteria bacterium]|jgi:glutaryl-CoA dehydrogenase|nr:acyl-CoA dehydrogenase family protein [Deltaproteobacteria bacterium]
MATQEIIDFYQTDALLSTEEKKIRDTVRAFVDRECMPIIAEHFDKGTFPVKLIPRLAALGLFGVHVDGYGCSKSNHTTYGLICQELGRCDSGLRAMFSVQNSLVMFPIYRFGSEQQREKWLPELAAGSSIGCFGLSEPGFGSNPAGMETRAQKKKGRFILNGKKMWITNGTIAKVAIVWAKYNEEIRGFLVETETRGFRASPIQRKFSYRTSPTALIELRDCAIEENNILPNARGLKSIFECLNFARYGVACGAVGSAVSCYQAARGFALEREVFDRPIAGYQLVQDRLVRMMVEITKAQLVNYHLGRLLDEHKARPAQISLAKMNNVQEAMEIARIARDILGARGILADHQVIRHLCDLEAISALEGTAGMHTLVIGKEITGISAFT